jgi:hypothetical protein
MNCADLNVPPRPRHSFTVFTSTDRLAEWPANGGVAEENLCEG